MLTGKQLEKFLKTQAEEKTNVWKGQLVLTEAELYYFFNIQGVKSVDIIFDNKIISLIPVNNGEFFLKKIVSDEIRFFTIELEELEQLKYATFEITVFD